MSWADFVMIRVRVKKNRVTEPDSVRVKLATACFELGQPRDGVRKRWSHYIIFNCLQPCTRDVPVSPFAF